MKKCINIIIILLVIIFCFDTNVKAEEIDSILEYYNISYDFLNDNEYYVTYEFKLNEKYLNVYDRYYFSDENIYLDTIEHNLDDLKLHDSYINDYAKMDFSLNESKEYFLKYKGFFSGNGIYICGICLKTISSDSRKDTCDNSNAVSVYSFELDIYHPENIKLDKDKIMGIHNLNSIEEGEGFHFLAGDKYEKNRYYDVSLYKEVILKEQLDKERRNTQIMVYIILSIIAIIFARIANAIVKEKMSKLRNNDNNSDTM